MVSIENLVHNDCFDYFSCLHFLSTIYSEYLIDFSYSSYLIYYSCSSSQVLQVITLKLLFSVIYIFGYFYLVQAYLYSFAHLLPWIYCQYLRVPSRWEFVLYCLFFWLFQLCVYYVAFCNYLIHVYVLQNEVRNLE
jgi:hypothetical protein